VTYFRIGLLSHSLKQKKSVKTFSGQRNNNKYFDSCSASEQVITSTKNYTFFKTVIVKLLYVINKYVRIGQLLWWLTYDIKD